MNKVILIGNLTKEPELATTSSGVSVCRFTIAVNRKFANSEGERETDFINCVAWRTKAEFIKKYFEKGNKIALEGSIQTRSYESSDGSTKHVTEVIVEECEFVQARKNEDVKSESKQVTMKEVDDDDLPF